MKKRNIEMWDPVHSKNGLPHRDPDVPTREERELIWDMHNVHPRHGKYEIFCRGCGTSGYTENKLLRTFLCPGCVQKLPDGIEERLAILEQLVASLVLEEVPYRQPRKTLAGGRR